MKADTFDDLLDGVLNGGTTHDGAGCLHLLVLSASGREEKDLVSMGDPVLP
jgi:hypothetical protein